MEMIAPTILIADDSADDVFLLKRLLENSKMLNPIREVYDGEETLCYLQGKGRYSDRKLYPYPLLMFLDYKMPGKNGLEVLEWIQTSHQDVQVIFLTGLESKSIQDAYRLGAATFLVKPLQFKDFVEVVDNLKGLQLKKVGDGYLLEAV